MTQVVVKSNESIDQALKRFKCKVQNDGIMLEIRKREYYVKPGIKRRLKHENALKARNKKKR